MSAFHAALTLLLMKRAEKKVEPPSSGTCVHCNEPIVRSDRGLGLFVHTRTSMYSCAHCRTVASL